VRLEATLGMRLTPAAVKALRAAAPGLTRVAAERVSDELAALLRLPATGRAVRRADALGVLAVVLPEVEPMRASVQPLPHRFHVLEHSLRALDSCDRVLARLDALVPFGEELGAHLAEPVGGGLTRGHVLKLGALLHDVSKPETRQVRDGRVRFFEHDVIGAARARDIGERLRLPGRVVTLLERLVRHHLRPMHLAQAGEITRRARLRFYRDLGADTRDLLLLSLVDAAAVTGASPLAVWRRAALIRDLLGGWAEAETAAAAPPLLKGEDVMARFGLPPGPAVGDLLGRAREAQDLGLVRTREEALAYLDSSGGAP
jgi:putative nucleotidyltransferase with HDIG domain